MILLKKQKQYFKYRKQQYALSLPFDSEFLGIQLEKKLIEYDVFKTFLVKHTYS